MGNKMFNKQFFEKFIEKNGDSFDSYAKLLYMYGDNDFSSEEETVKLTIFTDFILELKKVDSTTDDKGVTSTWAVTEYVLMKDITGVSITGDLPKKEEEKSS